MVKLLISPNNNWLVLKSYLQGSTDIQDEYTLNKLQTLHPVAHSDEMDMFEIIQAIWKHRTLILCIPLLTVTLSLIVLALIPNTYEVSSLLRPTAINNLDALNRSEIYTLPPQQALNKFADRLESYDTRLGFFKANPTLFEGFQKAGQSLEQGFEEFNHNSITVTRPDSKKIESKTYIRLDLRYPNGIDGASILNGLVDYAQSMEREEISADLKVIVDNRLAEATGKVDAARSSYEAEKESKIAKLKELDRLHRAQLKDELEGLRLQMKVTRSGRIAELTEAISIAKVMGIKHPSTPSSFGSEALGDSNQVIRTEINNQAVPLYFLGTNALEAELATLRQRSNDDFTHRRIAEISKDLKILEVNREIEILENRENEDIFLQNIEPLRTEMARLRAINVNMDNLNLVAIDRRAQEPIFPVRLPKTAIILASLLLGLTIGVILALIREVMTHRRNNAPIKMLEVSPVVARD